MLDKHCTSLELSKRLKALGVKQESNLYWMETDNHSGYFLTGEHTKEVIEENRNYCSKNGLGYYSAFLASELGEMLPATIGNKTWLSWVKSRNSFEDCYRISYDKWEHDKGAGLMLIKHVVDITMEKSMPDAFGLMLEYLIQNKLITI